MNVAIIFAGGTGQRMNTQTKPKQFLDLHGKPILIYTIEVFDSHPDIDGIIVVCLKEWINTCERMISSFGIQKVTCIIPGGETGFLSRYNGICKAYEMYDASTVILMHDGVRPLIDHDIVSRNIESVLQYGSAVTVSPAVETIAIKGVGNQIGEIIDRSKCEHAKAPQSFLLGDLYVVHQKAVEQGVTDCIDTAYLMQHYGYKIYSIESSSDNIKITTPKDYFTFKAILDARENSQIFGL